MCPAIRATGWWRTTGPSLPAANIRRAMWATRLRWSWPRAEELARAGARPDPGRLRSAARGHRPGRRAPARCARAAPGPAHGNLLKHIKVRHGDVDAGFAEADVIVERTYRTPMTEHAFLEPECSVAVPAGYDADHAKS